MDGRRKKETAKHNLMRCHSPVQGYESQCHDVIKKREKEIHQRSRSSQRPADEAMMT